MKIRLLLLVLLCAVLIACPALADKGKTPAFHSSVPDTAVLYTFPVAAPEGMIVSGEVAASIRLFYDQNGGISESEFISRLDITFISGDERLKDAHRVAKSPVSTVDENGNPCEYYHLAFQIHPVNSVIDSPATAVFHLYMESEHYSYEKDVTVCCVPWTDYAAFNVPGELPLAYPLSGDEEVLRAETVCNICLGTSLSAAVGRIREAFPALNMEAVKFFDVYLRVPDMWANSVSVSDLAQKPVDTLIIRGMGIDIHLPLKILPAAGSVSHSVPASGGLFADASWEQEARGAGYIVRLPDGGPWSSMPFSSDSYLGSSFCSSEIPEGLYAEYIIFPLDGDGLLEDPDSAMQWFDKELCQNLGSGEISYFDVDGHPAALVILPAERGMNMACGIYYPRNDRLLLTRISVRDPSISVDLGDLAFLASHFGYDESEAPMTAADAAVTVTAEGGAASVSAGGKLKFTASFENPNKVNAKLKNNGITWQVTEADTGETPSYAKISNGTLSVNKSLDRAVELEVTAVSAYYGTSGTCPITVWPALKGLAADPAELVFYTGSFHPTTLSVTADPAVLTLEGCAFSVSKAGIVEITDNGDGTAAVSPVASGKTDIVARAGGKTLKIKVLVADPVTAVEITHKGKNVPGGIMDFSGRLTPARPAVPDVLWAVDADESIAVISEKGRLKISKDAPAGTVITVTCTALGAPEPVSAACEITVEAK